MALTDEEFTEQISDLVGDIALGVARLLQPTNTNLFVKDDLNDVQHKIKTEWKSLTVRIAKLANESYG